MADDVLSRCVDRTIRFKVLVFNTWVVVLNLQMCKCGIVDYKQFNPHHRPNIKNNERTRVVSDETIRYEKVDLQR